MTIPGRRSRLELDTPEVYLRQRRALIRFFQMNDASDAEDLADEVFLRLLKSEADIENVPAFIHKIAENVLHEHWRNLEYSLF